jgi:hypothetical protein
MSALVQALIAGADAIMGAFTRSSSSWACFSNPHVLFIGHACITTITVVVWSRDLGFPTAFARRSNLHKVNHIDEVYNGKGYALLLSASSATRSSKRSRTV